MIKMLRWLVWKDLHSEEYWLNAFNKTIVKNNDNKKKVAKKKRKTK